MTPKEVRTLWVEKLLGGEYKQGKGYLQNDGKFCCLGVLCELAVKAKVIRAPRLMEDSKVFDYGKEENTHMILPFKVRDWAGLTDQNGSYCFAQCLSYKNDDGYSFEQIAEIITSDPLGLFVS